MTDITARSRSGSDNKSYNQLAIVILHENQLRIDEKWGFIDRQGTIVIEPSFDAAESFSQGLAKVKVGDKWGFIDRQGAVAIAPIYDEVDSFHDDMAWIRIDKKVGYIDQTGKFLQ
jgi:hypothetical protein